MAELKPEARVFMQNRRTGEIVELTGFSTINSTVAFNGGRADITFSNVNDKLFFRARKRGGLDGRSEVLDYLNNVFKLQLVREVNEQRRRLSEDLLAGNRTTSISLKEFLKLEFASEIGLMNQIWIDYRGRDGLWYAGFRGIVSGFTEQSEAGQIPSLTIGCKDMRRFLQLSQILMAPSQTGILVRTLQDIISEQVIKIEEKVVTNVFSGFSDPAAVIASVLDLVNVFFGPGAPASGSTLTDSGPPYYGLLRFWRIPGLVRTPDREYEGVVPIRDDDPLKFVGSNQIKTIGGLARLDLNFKANPFPVSLVSDTTFSEKYGYGEMAYLVDKSIVSSNIKPLQEVIREVYQLYNNERMTAEKVIADVTGHTFYDLWFDAMGNAIFQRPRYDDLPSYEIEGKLFSGDDVLKTFRTGKDRGLSYSPDDDLSGLQAFESPGSRRTGSIQGLRDHGRNYILGDESLKKFVASSDETHVYTAATVGSTLDWVDLDRVVQTIDNTGIKVADANTQRLFGVRIFSAQSVVSSTLGTLNKKHLDRAAAALFNRINAQANTMSAILVQRPDLQPGRTVLHAERHRLYYLTEVAQEFTQGESHLTTIRGEFGHLPENPIGDPWLISDANLQKLSGSDLRSLMDIIQQENQTELSSNLVLPEMAGVA